MAHSDATAGAASWARPDFVAEHGRSRLHARMSKSFVRSRKSFTSCTIGGVTQREDLLARLLAAQSEMRRRLHAAIPPGLQTEFVEFGGITVHQMELVRRLLLGDEMTMHDVASFLGIGPSGATQLVDRLGRRGLVVREHDPHDRRVVRVLPTDRAKAIARRFKAGMRRAAEDVLGGLEDQELNAFVELTERIAAPGQRDVRRCERSKDA